MLHPHSRRTREVRTCLAVVIVQTLAASVACASDWYVDQSYSGCSTGSGGPNDPFCTIGDALTVAADGDTIHIAPGDYSESARIFADLTVIGTQGASVTRVLFGTSGILPPLWVDRGASATVIGLSFENGISWSNGGGVYVDAGASLALEDCVVANCAATNFSYGGGIYNLGSLKMLRTTLRGNDAYFGGGLYDRSSGSQGLRIENCLITQNTATWSAGLHLYSTIAAEIHSTTISDNVASAGGGGMEAAGQEVELSNCTFSGNSGGALRVYSTNSGYSNVRLLHCTISGNWDDSSGGIGNSATVFLWSSTVAGNVATSGSGGGIYSGSGTIFIGHTVLADNSAQTGPDCFGTVTSLGYNLIEDTADCTIIGDPTGNLLGVDPLLSGLADNGGRTLTHRLLPGSPARDAGDPSITTGKDQRGGSRVLDGNCDGVAVRDMGAVEAGLTLIAEPRTLREGDVGELLTDDGEPFTYSLLVITAVDGVDASIPIDFGLLSDQGRRSISMVVPPGLSGRSMKLRAFAFDPCFEPRGSDPVRIDFE